MMHNLAPIENYRHMIETALETHTDSHKVQWGTVWEAARYALLGGGKRVRGVLTLEFCRLCGGDPKNALPFACAVEMIHAYSLIHDDLPSMDNDDTRRGKPSCHVAFGEGMALLAGDGLQALAFETLSKADTAHIPAKNIVAAAAILAAAAGNNGMVGGQVLDLYSTPQTTEDLILLSSMKTGALMKAAAKLGCLAGGGTEAQLCAAEGFAGKLGLAFQIRDDILDEIGNPSVLGKPVGSDRQNNKTTFASLLGTTEAGQFANTLMEEAISKLYAAFTDTAFLSELVRDLINREK